jgi:hypothetical protein
MKLTELQTCMKQIKGGYKNWSGDTTKRKKFEE